MDFIKQQNQLIQEAEACLTRIHDSLRAVVELSDDETGEGGSDVGRLRTLQLVLQFRLDTQDALQHLFQYSQSVWQIIGVSSQYSKNTNLERLAFALGAEDLHHTLSLLNQLIDKLLLVLQRYQSNQASQHRVPANRKSAALKAPPTTSRMYQKMVCCLDNQKSFNFILNQLTNSLEAIQVQEDMGAEVLDCICKLEGPISHFHQALQNGLVVSAGLYQQLEASCHLNHSLDEVLNIAREVLEQAPQLIEKPRLFQPTKSISTSQELEARAAEKRLGHFFRPY